MQGVGQQLQQWAHAICARATELTEAAQLGQLRAEALGKDGLLSQAMRELGRAAAHDRPNLGRALHAVRQSVTQALDMAARRLQAAAADAEQRRGQADLTLPGRRPMPGAPHPLRLMEQNILVALSRMGFTVSDGPLIEDDWHNFVALNIPADHPARDMQDTFFLAADSLLRTHTSNVQIRAMQEQAPPVRMASPGMVFRRDTPDATHTPAFHQVEGLWIDERATFADLKGVLRRLLADLFGPGASLRFRPSFFPFTEPSAEVDMACFACGVALSQGCRLCRGSGWIEILGCGMVDPAVLQAVGYDPERVQGFAFGVGLERLAMLRYGIDDIRSFYDNDARFLAQFAGGYVAPQGTPTEAPCG